MIDSVFFQEGALVYLKLKLPLHKWRLIKVDFETVFCEIKKVNYLNGTDKVVSIEIERILNIYDIVENGKEREVAEQTILVSRIQGIGKFKT